jgi:hypothetical protein
MKSWLILVLALIGRVVPVTAANPWSTETFVSQLRQKPDGTYCAVSATNGGCVVVFGPQGKEYTAPVPAEGFRVEHLYCLSTDTAGGLWLFPSSGRNTAYHDGKEWRIYRPDDTRGLRYHSKEIAFEAQLAKGENYRIGVPTDQYYPTFTRDGRILYQNEWRRVCYFDGQQWHAPYGNNEVGGSTVADHPFFHEGKVTVRVGGKCYQMPDGAWSKTVDDRDDPRPWQEVPDVPQPFSQHAAPRREIAEPADCPIPAGERTWKFQADGWFWVGSATQLVGSPGQEWIVISVADTPLATARQVHEVLADPQGRWFFGYDVRPYRYAVYQAERLTVQLGPAALGAVNRPFATLQPAWQANRKPDELQLRYRVDGGPWSDLRPCGPIDHGVITTPGRHRLQIEFFGRRELLRSVPLTYDFEVGYDLKQLIPALVVQLGASGSADREQASADLLRLGEAAVPFLTEAANHHDPEIRLRARDLLSALQPKSR